MGHFLPAEIFNYEQMFCKGQLFYEKQPLHENTKANTKMDQKGRADDAKCKWRSLINYLRQHLEHVADKKQRRYIPNTHNPEDRYIQLEDWPYYKELEFVVPYVKYAASKTGESSLNPTANEIDIIIASIEEDLGNSNDTANCNSIIPLDREEEINLTPEDIILKEFFENMLKSALNLPRFHQNRIMNEMMQSLNEQNE
ncbi:uncharacterized protein LOC106091611 isoform X2 [Stomoxys calcitrans]|uniref:uncharacterized protein LOC106091611 isoform X2 n=1 Tax=Stomoxys calcitrans TaxID=35570 RepID=UPI0027E2E78E|nr:uncharacterized protein LOC106091611 isoform X2 [Stomoxys calcitrans]XP_059217712.1 uncharacterized protein LOC106091611 isoform X2 [Stomoxys calcitrans]